MKRRTLLLGLGEAGLLTMTGHGWAQTSYPTRPVTMVVAYAAGGPTDNLARALAAALSDIWHQSVVVENRGGGGTIIGTQQVANAAPDGYTMLMTSYAYTSNPVLRKSLPYGPQALTPLALVGTNDLILLISGRSELKTLQDVIAYARKAPDNLKLASSGNASSPHIALEMFSQAIGARIMHLPYKGAGPAKNDVIAGVVDGIFDGTSSMSHIREGRLRAVAIAADQRHPLAPDVPTFDELGVKLEYGTWFGLFVPSATSLALQQKLHADVRRAMQSASLQKFAAEAGTRLASGSSQQFADYLGNQSRKLQALVDSGVKIQLE